MKRPLHVLAALGALALTVAACGPKLDSGAKPPSQQGSATQPAAGSEKKPEIVVGLSISLTGGTASYGNNAKAAVELAVAEFNRAGGYNGQQVRLVTYDDEAKPDKSVESIQRLINQDKAVAIVGPANSGNALAHIEIVQKAGVPEVIPVATATDITLKYKGEPKNYIFRTSMVDSAQVAVMLKHLQARGVQKVGILHDTAGYGQAGLAEVKKQLEPAGIKVAESASFKNGDSNMEPQVQKMKDAQLDTVILYTLAPEIAQILKAADKLGYKPAFVASWAASDPVVLQLAGDLVKKGNLFMVQSFTIDQSPAAADFHKRMQQAYKGYNYPIAAAQAYDAAQLILRAIRKVGPDPVKIRDAIEDMGDFKGVTAIQARPYSRDNHESLGPHNMFMAVYNDKGEIVKVR